MKHIPNFITSLNLAAGFSAIIFAADGSLLTASWLILAAMIFDFLDGFSARLLKAYSAIGRELDSLADVVSFGVAPAVIIFQLLDYSFSLIDPSIEISKHAKNIISLAISAIMPVCAALRLAKFNTDTTQAKSFKGLPTPANALAVISVIITGHYSKSVIFSFNTGLPIILTAYTVILSVLMVSRIPLISLKFSDLKLKGNEGLIILSGLVLLSFIFLGISAALLIIPLYIISSYLSRLF